MWGKIVCICGLLSVISPCQEAQRNDTLVLRLTNVAPRVGAIDVTAYKNDASFLNDTGFFLDRIVRLDNCAASETCDITFVLPYDEYAFVAYQDINSNGKLDVNFIGYPKEPFAFSRPFRPTFRAPKFREISYQCRSCRDTLVIPLMK
jgi:uncharacterized protein (DUF2141 family)